MSKEAKYTCRLLYDVPGHAYHHRCKALQKYAPDDFDIDIGPDYGAAFRRKKYDLVLQLCYSHTRTIRRHIEKAGYKMVVVAGINVSGASAAPWIRQNLDNAEYVILNSRAAYPRCIDRCKHLWPNNPEPQSRLGWISNGVDLDIFHPTDDPTKRKTKVVSIGSKFHTQTGGDNKGIRTVLNPMVRPLKKAGYGVDFQIFNSHATGRKNLKQMAEWYNRATIYVVASKREGTPNPALEAAACGCVLVATKVGNMPELIKDGENGYIVNRDKREIMEAIQRAQQNFPRLSAQMQKDIQPWHWKVRGQQYYDLFRRLIDEYRAGKRLKTAKVG